MNSDNRGGPAYVINCLSHPILCLSILFNCKGKKNNKVFALHNTNPNIKGS